MIIFRRYRKDGCQKSISTLTKNVSKPGIQEKFPNLVKDIAPITVQMKKRAHR